MACRYRGEGRQHGVRCVILRHTRFSNPRTMSSRIYGSFSEQREPLALGSNIGERNNKHSSFDSVYRPFILQGYQLALAFLFDRKEFDWGPTSQSLVWFSRLRARDAYEMNAVTVLEWILFLDFPLERKLGIVSMRLWVALSCVRLRIGKLIIIWSPSMWLAWTPLSDHFSFCPGHSMLKLTASFPKCCSSFPVYSLALAYNGTHTYKV